MDYERIDIELFNYFFQLTTQMVYKKAFLDYSEADIAFSPTYKYDPGTDEWDSR